jgi:hypothetical protein
MLEQVGCARRAIDLRAQDDSVEAWLEDDFHHFGIVMRHDGEKVISVEGEAARFPRDTCPGALDILQEVVGMRLSQRSTAIGKITNMRMHCTHLYDLLGLAIAHAACGREHRRYDAIVPDRQPIDGAPPEDRLGGTTQPQLFCDGHSVMAWQVRGDQITGPGKYTGISMGRGFREWTETLDIDEAEAAHVLRRATLIALGRLIDLQALGPEGMKGAEGACHSFQPEVIKNSGRMLASSKDYSECPESLLLHLDL